MTLHYAVSIGKGAPTIRAKNTEVRNQMDHTKFDSISRVLASGASRRTALTALLGSALGIGTFTHVDLDELEAGGRRRKKARKAKKKKQKVKDTPACRQEGHPCEGNQKCCAGLECRVTGPGNAERCAKKEPPKECKGKCSHEDPCPDLKDCECVFQDVASASGEREGVCKTVKPEPPKCVKDGDPCDPKIPCCTEDATCEKNDKYVEVCTPPVCVPVDPCTGLNCGPVKDNCDVVHECECNGAYDACKEGVCVACPTTCNYYATTNTCCPGYECDLYGSCVPKAA